MEMREEQNFFCCFALKIAEKLVGDYLKQIHTWSQQQMDFIYLLLVQLKDVSFSFASVSSKLELCLAQFILSKRQKHGEIG